MNVKWIKIRKIVIILGWLLLWQFISIGVGNKILLVGPIETLLTLLKLLTHGEFWGACMGSLLRITLGFVAGMLLGVFLAVKSAKYSWLEEILAPVMTFIKAVPVASFVVIFLIWWGSARLAAVISFCMVFPNLYINTLEGIKSTDIKLLEMAQVFRVSGKNRFFYIYRPAMKPFLDSAVKVSAGMSWKSGVAAEVIGLPTHAIGEQLYLSKIYLDTAGVLAWTLVIIFLSTGFEKLIMYLWRRFCEWEPYCQDRGAFARNSCVEDSYKKNSFNKHSLKSADTERQPVTLTQITKRYGEQTVINNLTVEYLPNNSYYLNSPSGSGKTTLLRILAGLEKPDAGVVEKGGQSVAFLFQEDRLCEQYSAIKNVELVTGNREVAKLHLLQLLEEDDLEKPCSALSGGMKRRVAIARTMAVAADLILLDEPYNGLDEANRIRVREYIKKYSEGSIILIASHIV